MSRFLEALHSGRVLLMDGAMGTELQRAGLPAGQLAAVWSLVKPKQVRAVHRAYLKAGAEVLLSNTFLMNTAEYVRQLHEAGTHCVSGIEDGWRAAFDAMGPGSFYRLAVRGPYIWKVEREFDNLNWLHLPGKKCSLTRPHSCHHIPDAFLLETCSTPRARYALGRLQIEDVPQGMVSLAYQRNGKGKLVTQSGHSPEWFARRAKDWGCVALGINCGKDIGMDDIIEIVRRYRQETDLPLFARPNAGTPTRKGKKLVYPLTPQALADRLPELLGAGVCMVGGCCGTRPEHIAACRRIIDEWNRATTRTQQMQGARGT